MENHEIYFVQAKCRETITLSLPKIQNLYHFKLCNTDQLPHNECLWCIENTDNNMNNMHMQVIEVYFRDTSINNSKISTI